MPNSYPRRALAALLVFVACGVPGVAPAQQNLQQLEGVGPRTGSAAVWDSVRGRVVAFGGSGPGMTLDETIEWDGSRWTLRRPTTTPGPRILPKMAFDAARGETVLFAGQGFINDTWTWNGDDWSLRSPVSSPPPRGVHAMAYDPIRERVVLFGGRDAAQNSLGDTWLWDGTTWTRAAPTANPPGRAFHEMAWDPITNRVLMYGGSAGTTVFGDTWAWDGSDWIALAPAVTPGPLSTLRMATDTTRQRVLLGHLGGGSPRYNLWEWGGQTWAPLPTTGDPGRPDLKILVHDGNTASVIAAFGRSGSSSALDTWSFDGTDWAIIEGVPFTLGFAACTDSARGVITTFARPSGSDVSAWEWDGGRWHRRTSTNAPPERYGLMAMAYDRARQNTVLFGGSTPNPTTQRDQTWTWDGVDWTLRAPAASPPARIYPGMAYDDARQRCVLFGGLSGSVFTNDTWEWNGATWIQRAPATIPTALRLPRLAYDARRQRIVMVGTNAGVAPSTVETWEWDATDWRQVTTLGQPPAESSIGATLVDDELLQRITFFSGGETWTYDGLDWTNERVPAPSFPFFAAWDSVRQRIFVVDSDADSPWLFGSNSRAVVDRVGVGCGGFAGVPTLTPYGLPSFANDGFRLGLVSARPASAAILQFTSVPTAIPFGGCTLLAATGGFTATLPTTNSGGYSEQLLPIPASTTLAGLPLTCQAVVLDANGAGLGLVSTTQGLRLTIGD